MAENNLGQEREQEQSGSDVRGGRKEAITFRLLPWFVGAAIVGIGALTYFMTRDFDNKEKNKKQDVSATNVYNSKYGLQAGPLGTENTNLTINAPHFTRKNLTFLVETNQYATPNELSWLLRPTNGVDLHTYSDTFGKKFEADGVYLIPTLRTNANGEPQKGFNISNSLHNVNFVKEQELKDYSYGDKINVTLSDPLVKVPVLGTDYYMPDAKDMYGNKLMRVIPVNEDQTFVRDGQRFLPGPVYGINLVSKEDYLLRGVERNKPQTNAVVEMPVNYGAGSDSN